MAKKLKVPNPNPSANEDMMPKGMGEIARQMLEQGKKERQPTRISDDGYKRGGKVKKYARGGGIESRGKTRGAVVKMARGGGIESRGKTRGKFV